MHRFFLTAFVWTLTLHQGVGMKSNEIPEDYDICSRCVSVQSLNTVSIYSSAPGLSPAPVLSVEEEVPACSFSQSALLPSPVASNEDIDHLLRALLGCPPFLPASHPEVASSSSSLPQTMPPLDFATAMTCLFPTFFPLSPQLVNFFLSRFFTHGEETVPGVCSHLQGVDALATEMRANGTAQSVLCTGDSLQFRSGGRRQFIDSLPSEVSHQIVEEALKALAQETGKSLSAPLLKKKTREILVEGFNRERGALTYTKKVQGTDVKWWELQDKLVRIYGEDALLSQAQILAVTADLKGVAPVEIRRNIFFKNFLKNHFTRQKGVEGTRYKMKSPPILLKQNTVLQLGTFLKKPKKNKKLKISEKVSGNLILKQVTDLEFVPQLL